METAQNTMRTRNPDGLGLPASPVQKPQKLAGKQEEAPNKKKVGALRTGKVKLQDKKVTERSQRT